MSAHSIEQFTYTGSSLSQILVSESIMDQVTMMLGVRMNGATIPTRSTRNAVMKEHVEVR